MCAPLEMEAFLNSFYSLSTCCIPLPRLHIHYHLFNPDNSVYEGGITMIVVLQMRKLSFRCFELGQEVACDPSGGLCGVTHFV